MSASDRGSSLWIRSSIHWRATNDLIFWLGTVSVARLVPRCAAVVGRGNGGGDGVIDGTDPVDLVAGVALFGSGSASGSASMNQLTDSSDDDKSSGSSASLSPDCSALVAV